MLKRIRTRKGDVVNYDDYVAGLREQYNTLMAAETSIKSWMSKLRRDGDMIHAEVRTISLM